MSDHRALIERARRTHYTSDTASGVFVCFRCTSTGIPVEWPCLTARLADALEHAYAAPPGTGDHAEHCDCFRQSRAANAGWVQAYGELLARVDAAERRAAELEREALDLRQQVLDGGSVPYPLYRRAVDRAWKWRKAERRLEQRVEGAEGRAENFRQGSQNLDVALREAWQQREAAERRAAERDEMFERQAAAVRHHTDRADALARDLAAARGANKTLTSNACSSGRRAERLETWAKKRGHQPECRASIAQRPNGDSYGPLGPCRCGLAAALADHTHASRTRTAGSQAAEGVPTAQLRKGTHTGRNSRRTGG